MEYWPSTRQKPPIIQREFRGVNKLDAFSIRDVFATDIKNLTSSAFPALTVRPGYTVLGSAIGTKVLGLGTWKDTELHAVFSDGTWRKWNGSAWDTLKSGLSTTDEAYFTNFLGSFDGINLIMSNGTDAIMKYDGTSVSNLSDAPIGGNFITTYQNRLWCVADNELLASALDNGEDWTIVALDESKAYGKVIESPIGESMNGLFGDLSKLTISFPNSMRKLLGGVPSDFNDQNVSQSMGIVNHKSSVTLDGFMYLYSRKGFYMYGGGLAPERDNFSEVVQYYADQSNETARSTSVVGSDGNSVFFGIPLSSSTAPDTILQYDRTFRIWNVWKDIAPLHIVKMRDDLYIGDALGRVLKLGGTTDAGDAINWHMISKPFTGSSMSQILRFPRMWVTCDLPTGSTLAVYLSKSPYGDSDWEQVGTITASTDLRRKPIYVASNKVINARQIRYKIEGTGPCTIYEVAWEQQELPLR